MTDLRPVPPTPGPGPPAVALSEAERAAVAALREMQHGELEVVVHGARIVQITRRQKLRIDGR